MLGVTERFFDLIDALDFVHPVVLIAGLVAAGYAIQTFLPLWVGIILLVFIGVPVLTTFLHILYVGYSTIKNKK